MFTAANVAASIDHTLLKPDASSKDVEFLCQTAMEYGFYAVCIQPCYVKNAVELLLGSRVKVATVIGFPHGSSCSDVKGFEANLAFEQGADEVDMVINIGAVKSGDWDVVSQDIKKVAEVALHKDKLLKVIIETALLTQKEKIMVCKYAIEAGAHFVKTSTGFNGSGANLEDVELMLSVIGDKAKIKASGGIRNWQQARKFLECGVHRLGTSSGVAIINEMLDVK